MSQSSDYPRTVHRANFTVLEARPAESAVNPHES